MTVIRIGVCVLLASACGSSTVPGDSGARDAGTHAPLDGGADAGADSGTRCADPDRDRDGYFDPACGTGERYNDCDDDDPLRNPGEREVCDPNDVDEDCDPCTVGGDADSDGYVNARCCNAVGPLIPSACEDGTLVLTARGICGTDCVDTNAAIHPGAEEVCNGLDDDCDGWSDSSEPTLVYADLDRDGHGDRSPGAATLSACVPPTGYSGTNDDCDDTDARVSPRGLEGCNGRDDDCDGRVDESPLGIGVACDLEGVCEGDGRTVCDGGAVRCSSDRATDENCNGVDDDCDGSVDEALTSDCDPNECGATGTAYCFGGHYECRYDTFPERPGAAHPCGTITETCTSDGAWRPSTLYPSPRACTTLCGAGLERCTDEGWSACADATVVACETACPLAAVGLTTSSRECSGGVFGECVPVLSPPLSAVLALSGGDPYCGQPASVPSATVPPTCSAGSAVLTLEAGRYRACAVVQSRRLTADRPSAPDQILVFPYPFESAMQLSVTGAAVTSPTMRVLPGRAVARRSAGSLFWWIELPARFERCAEVTVASCADVGFEVNGLRSPDVVWGCVRGSCNFECAPVPGGELCQTICRCEEHGFVTSNQHEAHRRTEVVRID
ncbi:MAG: putative metal-binding motif-containing protein [Sandaracinaceae bacterium]|nr:putative metal-binding motif-containing protein [Sandaracinaceae bacterium]